MSTSISDSPLDFFPCVETLDGYVSDLSQGFKIHGEDMMRRMSQGASFSQMVLLTLTGELPSPMQVTRYERALQLAAMMDVGEAPCHAARLARVQRARPHSVASVACISLANRAQSMITHTEAMMAWVEDPSVGLDPARPHRLVGEQSVSATAALRGFRDELLCVLQEHEPSLDECIIALLHLSGLTQAWQKEAALTMAGIPMAMAEAFFAPARLSQYPVHVPRFEYHHEM